MAEVREYVYIINIDDWTPQNHYNTAMSLPDGKNRKIHLDEKHF